MYFDFTCIMFRIYYLLYNIQYDAQWVFRNHAALRDSDCPSFYLIPIKGLRNRLQCA